MDPSEDGEILILRACLNGLTLKPHKSFVALPQWRNLGGQELRKVYSSSPSVCTAEATLLRLL